MRGYPLLSLSSSACAVMNLAGLQHYSDQHTEFGLARRRKDFKDCNKFYSWHSTRNLSWWQTKTCNFLSTGIVSNAEKDDVNPDKAEEIGRASFDSLSINECHGKRKNTIKPMSSLMKMKGEKDARAEIDHKDLFNRLLVGLS